MIRQHLLNELDRVYDENHETIEKMRDESYVFVKYPYLHSLFEQYLKTTKHREQWHQIARERLCCDKNDLRYMYDRTRLLIRSFQPNSSEYFSVETDLGSYTLPDRLSDLNRLFELYIDFFTIIYPNINKKLSFYIETAKINSKVLREKIDWPSTIIAGASQGNPLRPLRFTTFLNKHQFETPENILTLVYVLKLKQDAQFLGQYQYTEPLNFEERVILSKIYNGCDNILKSTILSDLIPIALSYYMHEDSNLKNLEAQCSLRLQHEKVNDPYYQLFLWGQKYRNMNLRGVSTNKTNFPIDRTRNWDTMFEVWILLELLYYLKKNNGAVITTPRFPKHFIIDCNGSSFDFYYEKNYTGWATDAKPDFSIEREGKIKMVMDAKNWLESKGDAIYKMLGYLNNLDGTSGILFFPNDVMLGIQRISKGATLVHHQQQLLYNCVIPPSSSELSVSQKLKALEKTTQLILQSLDN